MSNEALNTVLSHLVIPVVVIHDAATTPAVTDGLVVGGPVSYTHLTLPTIYSV